MDELQHVGRAHDAGRARRSSRTASTRFTDWIDGLGDEPDADQIAVLRRDRGRRGADRLRRHLAQVEASVNCPVGMVYAALPTAPSAASSAARSRTARATCARSASRPRAGTVVNPVLPAACGARGVIGYRVFDAIMGALAPVVPDRVIAAGEGGPTLIALGGYDEDGGRSARPRCSSAPGARAPSRDGLEGVSNPLANLGNQPVELIEADLPLEVERYGVVPDSGGAGAQRGGLAYVREYELLADEAMLTIRTDRRDHPPYGFDGGEPGAPSSNVVVSGGEARELPTMPMEARRRSSAGDMFRHVSAGGGGFGDPFGATGGRCSRTCSTTRSAVDAARDCTASSLDRRRVDRRRRDARSSRAARR